MLGAEGFARIRMGIGRSPTVPTEDYVLAAIPMSENKLYEEAIQLAANAVETFLEENLQKAMNLYNTRKNHEP